MPKPHETAHTLETESTNTPQIRVAVIDDSTLVRHAFGGTFSALDIVGSYESAEKFLESAPEVDLVVLDLHLRTSPDDRTLQGREAINRLVDAGYRVCLYTDESRILVLAECVRAGAGGLVRKSDPLAASLEAFMEVAAGRYAFSHSIVGLAEVLARRDRLPQLTDRQREVLAARARGERWSSIGRRLFISEGVAREHMDKVFSKMASYLQAETPGDLEYELGMRPGDLI